LAAGAFGDTSGPAAWSTIPSWAIIGTDDQAIPPAELQFMANRAGSKIDCVKAGHLSMITMADAAARQIIEAAVVDRGRRVADVPIARTRRADRVRSSETDGCPAARHRGTPGLRGASGDGASIA
jgi:hypothetical protein